MHEGAIKGKGETNKTGKD